jgi:hypothetical protein
MSEKTDNLFMGIVKMMGMTKKSLTCFVAGSFIHGFAIVSLAVGAASAQQKVETLTLTDIRGMRYCEFLLITDDGVVIYNTSASNGCPDDKWKAMDVAKEAANHGAKKVQLNGPHFWAMDEQTIGMGKTKTFGGIDARYAATLPLAALGSGEGTDPYKPYTSAKLQTMVFKSGSQVYELVDSEGNAYILNAYGDEVTGGDPANLADQLSPADGWKFQVTTLTDDLTIVGTNKTPVQMVGDDMHQYYTQFSTDVK